MRSWSFCPHQFRRSSTRCLSVLALAFAVGAFALACGSPGGGATAPPLRPADGASPPPPDSKSSVEEVSSPLTSLGITEIRAGFEEGTLTSEKVVRACVRQILAKDRRYKVITYPAPNDRSISSFAPALEAAKRADRERARWRSEGADSSQLPPLHGIPFLVKDSYDVRGMPTSAGSAVLELWPDTDAPLVAKLREAGAIVLGKANMSELALSAGRLGYSSLRGTTVNPHNTRRDASGSSSGPAAGVALGFAPFALGTDTVGSIRDPAAASGVIGLKPTYGALSTDSIVPAALSLDTPGVLARSAKDAAVVFATLASSASIPNDFETRARTRAGLLLDFSNLASADIAPGVETALQCFRERGVLIDELSLPGDLRPASLWPQVLGPIVQSEFAPDLNAYLAEREPFLTLETITEKSEDYNRAGPEQWESTGTYEINPGRIAGYKQALGFSNRLTLDKAKRSRRKWTTSLQAIFEKRGFDVLLYPTLLCEPGPLWLDEERRFEKDPSYRCTANDPFVPGYLASATGYPEISLPVARTRNGLPIGLSILGREGSETRLLSLASACSVTMTAAAE